MVFSGAVKVLFASWKQQLATLSGGAIQVEVLVEQVCSSDL
jgi:hypothetical protein